MKSMLFSQTGRVVEVRTEDNILKALLAEQIPVKMACGGRGICATCHVHIEQGRSALTPITKRETRALSLLASADDTSRLACQAKVIGDGVVVRLPSGLYIERVEDLDDLVGRRTEENILHPVTGKVLVRSGKIILRSVLSPLRSVETDLQDIMSKSHDVE